jgi:hypothetical protein
LDLPVPEVQPLLRSFENTFEESFLYNQRMWEVTQYGPAYFEWSLARKNDVPFVM